MKNDFRMPELFKLFMKIKPDELLDFMIKATKEDVLFYTSKSDQECQKNQLFVELAYIAVDRILTRGDRDKTKDELEDIFLEAIERGIEILMKNLDKIDVVKAIKLAINTDQKCVGLNRNKSFLSQFTKRLVSKTQQDISMYQNNS